MRRRHARPALARAVSSGDSARSASGCAASASAADALTVFGLLASVVTARAHRVRPPRLGRRRRDRGRRQRPARRRDRAGQRAGEPARRVLRLGHRPRLRRAAARRRRVVPRSASRRTCPILAFAVAALLDDHLVRAGPRRGARHRRPRRADGARRAVRVPRHRPRVRHPRAGAVGDARAHRVHRRAPVRARVPAGRSSAAHARDDPPDARRDRRPRPALRDWWTARRVDGDRRRRHRSARRSPRP